MNLLDILILVALFIPTFIGLKQGIIKAVLSLAGLIIGVILAGNFYHSLAQLLGFIPNADIANIVAFILILVVVMLIVTLLIRLLKFITSVVMISWVDHVGGAIFGFLMGAILWGAILSICVKLFGTDLVTESFMAGVLLDKFPLILALLPKEFDAVRDFFSNGNSSKLTTITLLTTALTKSG